MIYMLIGIQGSGKSTYARKLSIEKGIKIISSDKVRQDFTGIPEKIVWMFLYTWLAACVRRGEDVIFDATSITKYVRKNFFNKLKSYNINTEITAIEFIPNVELSKKRVALRNEDPNELYLPLEVIDQYAAKMESASLDEGFTNIIKIES